MAEICETCRNTFPTFIALVRHLKSCDLARKKRNRENLDEVVSTTIMSRLPIEMVDHIISFLETSDILNFAMTCKEWQKLAVQLSIRPTLFKFTGYLGPDEFSDAELTSNLINEGRMLTFSNDKCSTTAIDLLDPNFKQTIALCDKKYFEEHLPDDDDDYFDHSYDEWFEFLLWKNAFFMGNKILLHGVNTDDHLTWSRSRDYLCVLGHPKLTKMFQNYDSQDTSHLIKIDDSTLIHFGGTKTYMGGYKLQIKIIHFDAKNEADPFTVRKGPKLKQLIYGHAMIKSPSGKVYIIGGTIYKSYKTQVITNKTWIIDPKDGYKITAGPKMKLPRSHHSVGIMESGSRYPHIVVIGGTPFDGENSAEYLDPQTNKWVCIDVDLEQPVTRVSIIGTLDRYSTFLIGDSRKVLKFGKCIYNVPPASDQCTNSNHLKPLLGSEVKFVLQIPYHFPLSTIGGS